MKISKSSLHERRRSLLLLDLPTTTDIHIFLLYTYYKRDGALCTFGLGLLLIALNDSLAGMVTFINSIRIIYNHYFKSFLLGIHHIHICFAIIVILSSLTSSKCTRCSGSLTNRSYQNTV